MIGKRVEAGGERAWQGRGVVTGRKYPSRESRDDEAEQSRPAGSAQHSERCPVQSHTQPVGLWVGGERGGIRVGGRRQLASGIYQRWPGGVRLGMESAFGETPGILRAMRRGSSTACRITSRQPFIIAAFHSA
ncbi:hypothetical protein GCM10009647_053370 [Streptomyces sanglieri]